MQDDLVDDRLLCEDSPFNLEVSHFSVGIGELLHSKQPNPLGGGALDQNILADAFHACFSHEVALHPSADHKAEAWLREFFTSGAADKLRDKTVGKQLQAEAAAYEVARKLQDYCLMADDDAGQEGEGFPGISRRIRSVKDAAEAAVKEAESQEKLGQTLGAGVGGKLSQDEFQSICERLKRSKSLRTILDIAGGMVEFRAGIKKKKVAGFDMVDGVQQSGDITRLLPSEIMQLAGGPLLATNMLRRLVENQTLALRKHSQERAGKGPIVLVLDGSGSMGSARGKPSQTPPILEAKALALTLARIAKEQKRWIALVEFGNRNEWKELIIQPDSWDMDSLLDWLEHFHDGGTDFVVLKKVVDAWSRWKLPRGQADIVFATDARARFDDDVVRVFNDHKKRFDVKCYGLAINSSTGDLPLVCDKSWTTHSMGLHSQAIREILSNNA